MIHVLMFMLAAILAYAHCFGVIERQVVPDWEFFRKLIKTVLYFVLISAGIVEFSSISWLLVYIITFTMLTRSMNSDLQARKDLFGVCELFNTLLNVDKHDNLITRLEKDMMEENNNDS